MKQNVGTLDAMIRIMLGFIGLAYSIARLMRHPYRTYPLMVFLSAMKIAEGITRFCPLLAILNISTTGQGEKRPYRILHYPRRWR
jgi:hypothetical protein